MGRRTVLLVAALVIAALGTTMVFLYVNGVNDRAIADQHPVEVLVAKTLVEAGTSVAAADANAAFEHKTISKNDLLPGALNQLTPIKDLTASTTIYPGEQIIPAKFGDRGVTSPLTIPAGKLAKAVELDDPAQVAGFVDAGSYVAIFYTASVAKGGGQEQTQLLLGKVQVLAIGNKTAVPLDTTTTTGTETPAVSTTILTLALGQRDYQRITFAASQGQLNLGLLGKDFIPTDSVGPTNQSNLFD